VQLGAALESAVGPATRAYGSAGCLRADDADHECGADVALDHSATLAGLERQRGVARVAQREQWIVWPLLTSLSGDMGERCGRLGIHGDDVGDGGHAQSAAMMGWPIETSASARLTSRTCSAKVHR
jgi:hypothetical protein